MRCEPQIPAKMILPFEVFPPNEATTERVTPFNRGSASGFWIFRSSAFTAILAFPFLFVRPMFPSFKRAEPQGFTLRPGPLPSAPFPMKRPAAPVGLAGLACSGFRLSPVQSLRHQQNVEGWAFACAFRFYHPA